MKKLKTRQEQKTADCWDLDQIVKEDEYLDLIKLVKEKNKEIVAMKGHILDNVDTLEKYLKLNEEESRVLERLYIYTRLKYDIDTTNGESKRKMLEIRNINNEIEETESFITSELMEKDFSYVKKLLEEKESLKEYMLYFQRVYKDKERILSEREEAIITQAKSAFGTPEDAFNALDNTDVNFGKISISKGKKVEVTHYNYGEFLEHENQEVRKQAFSAVLTYYKNHKNTLAALLKGNEEELEFIRKIRKYESALEMALDSINVSKDVYENLIESVHKYMDMNVEFQKLKAKMLGNKEYHLYDTYVPIVMPPKQNYKVKEAINIINKALEPLGTDYLKHFNDIIKNGTVDYYPNVGKVSGAYQWGCFDSPSYVLLNFNGTMDSVSTLAHEMGHAVHSMYSKENNSFIYADYEIFLAEIASTVNETLLSFYMLEHAEEKEEKIYYLCEFLDKVKATIYRQTMFSEFEKILSEKCQNKESLTDECITDVYYKLNEEYFKDSVIVDSDIRYECYRISHFYRPFYVYQYATGLISALSIVSDILNKKDGFKEKYINFLKSGSSKDVLDILKSVDVDLTKMETYDKVFQLINNKLNELKTLLKEGE